MFSVVRQRQDFFFFLFLEMAAALFNGVTFDLEALHLKLFE